MRAHVRAQLHVSWCGYSSSCAYHLSDDAGLAKARDQAIVKRTAWNLQHHSNHAAELAAHNAARQAKYRIAATTSEEGKNENKSSLTHDSKGHIEREGNGEKVSGPNHL